MMPGPDERRPGQTEPLEKVGTSDPLEPCLMDPIPTCSDQTKQTPLCFEKNEPPKTGKTTRNRLIMRHSRPK